MKDSALKIWIVLLLLIAGATVISAQSTSFTYQGKLSNNGVAANGSYDIEFRLFDIASGGAAIATQQKLNVQVSDGVFAVQLDYGSDSFPGSTRYIEMAVKASGGGSFTTMSPRTLIGSTPYAIRSMTADTAINTWQLGGINAGSFVQTTDSRLSDARPPTPGSGSYIQNTFGVQANTNFHIGGDGRAEGTLSANSIDATSSYRLGGSPFISADTFSNTFLGKNAGVATTPVPAGVEGRGNSFFGFDAGLDNTSGYSNSFYGSGAGVHNTWGPGNVFVGSNAGFTNTGGSWNAFVGEEAGYANANGGFNAFFGQGAGGSNVSGSGNTFLGRYTGYTNTTGTYNSLIGVNADVGSSGLTNATAIGANALVAQSNSIVLGSINGVHGGLGDTNVGIGTTTPRARLHIAANNGNMLVGDPGCSDGFMGIGFVTLMTGCQNYSLIGDGTDTIINRPFGGRIIFRENNSTQMTIAPGGAVSITTLGSAGSTQLCRNASNQISTCSSSLRYKKELQPFTGGLALIDRLNPITFRWKSDNTLDLGFGAEDVAKVEPLLASRNENGEIEGVKYDRISTVLVNAVKEQQTQIATLQKQVSEQKDLIDGMRKLVCQNNPQAEVCK